MNEFTARIMLMLLLAPLALIIMMPVIAYTRIESRIVSTNIYKRTLEHSKYASVYIFSIIVFTYVNICLVGGKLYPFYAQWLYRFL